MIHPFVLRRPDWRLPFAPVKVSKDADGNRVIAGHVSFDDTCPDVPLVERDLFGNIKQIRPDERRARQDAIRLKAERAAKRAANRAAKGLPPKSEKAVESKIRQAPAPKPVEPNIQTVKRDGKWVQVGSDNLSAFIEAR